MNRIRTVALTTLVAGLAATACSAGGRTPTTVISVAPAPTTSPVNDLPPISLRSPLDVDLTNDDDPAGSPVDFAIRYLNDLREGRWSAALDEMAYVERLTVDVTDSAATVGREVLRNASGGTGHLARCTTGDQFARNAVIVTCGRGHVVVHVETLRGFRGVQVSDLFVAGDHPGRAHTHAYSRLV